MRRQRVKTILPCLWVNASKLFGRVYGSTRQNYLAVSTGQRLKSILPCLPVSTSKLFGLVFGSTCGTIRQLRQPVANITLLYSTLYTVQYLSPCFTKNSFQLPFSRNLIQNTTVLFLGYPNTTIEKLDKR